MFASLKHLHMCGFFNVVNLLGSAPDTSLHLMLSALYKSLEIWVMIKELKDL